MLARLSTQWKVYLAITTSLLVAIIVLLVLKCLYQKLRQTRCVRTQPWHSQDDTKAAKFGLFQTGLPVDCEKALVPAKGTSEAVLTGFLGSPDWETRPVIRVELGGYQSARHGVLYNKQHYYTDTLSRNASQPGLERSSSLDSRSRDRIPSSRPRKDALNRSQSLQLPSQPPRAHTQTRRSSMPSSTTVRFEPSARRASLDETQCSSLSTSSHCSTERKSKYSAEDKEEGSNQFKRSSHNGDVGLQLFFSKPSKRSKVVHPRIPSPAPNFLSRDGAGSQRQTMRISAPCRLGTLYLQYIAEVEEREEFSDVSFEPTAFTLPTSPIMNAASKRRSLALSPPSRPTSLDNIVETEESAEYHLADAEDDHDGYVTVPESLMFGELGEITSLASSLYDTAKTHVTLASQLLPSSSNPHMAPPAEFTASYHTPDKFICIRQFGLPSSLATAQAKRPSPLRNTILPIPESMKSITSSSSCTSPRGKENASPNPISPYVSLNIDGESTEISGADALRRVLRELVEEASDWDDSLFLNDGFKSLIETNSTANER